MLGHYQYKIIERHRDVPQQLDVKYILDGASQFSPCKATHGYKDYNLLNLATSRIHLVDVFGILL